MSEAQVSRTYHVHEFAELAGVTVKALHHYDRLGLLKPRRTDAGYRMYAEEDLERLEQIVALKFLGFPLKQVKDVLDRTPLEWPDALRLQRTAIEDQRARLDRAIRAIRAAEDALESGTAASPAILKQIIEVIDVQDGIDAMKKYYSEAAWERARHFYEEGPSAQWQELYRDVAARLDEDPAGDQAQALAARWLALAVKSWLGDPEAQTDSQTAWMDREHWPPAMKRRVADFNLEEVTAFIERAAVSSPQKYFSEEAWDRLLERRTARTVEQVSSEWQARVDLFRDIERAIGEDPAGETAQALARRWLAQMETSSGGDDEIRAGWMKAWADRLHWSAALRWQMESLSMMTSERFEKCADFIEKATKSL